MCDGLDLHRGGQVHAGPRDDGSFRNVRPDHALGLPLRGLHGGVFNYGAGAPFLALMGGQPLNKPIVGMAVMPAGDGYYLVASDGTSTTARLSSTARTGSLRMNQPIVGMAVTANGAGYWLVASDGGIFSYGDAQFYGSTGNFIHLNKPIVGMAATPYGKGYYLVASDGGIFNYGDAAFDGSAGSLPLNKPVVGMTVPRGVLPGGLRRGIFTYPANGGPPFYGSTVLIKAQQADRGYDRSSGGLLPERLGRRGVHLPGHGWPYLLRLDGSIVLNVIVVGSLGRRRPPAARAQNRGGARAARTAVVPLVAPRTRTSTREGSSSNSPTCSRRSSTLTPSGSTPSPTASNGPRTKWRRGPTGWRTSSRRRDQRHYTGRRGAEQRGIEGSQKPPPTA